jgi:hypothetical protein
MKEVWRELLAPESPLVEQPWELQDALLRPEPHRKAELIRKTCQGMSDGALHVLDALALYHLHIYQISRGDMAGAVASAEEGTRKYGPILDDVRRLADVLRGISSGRLMGEHFVGAKELLVDVLEPEAAYAILDEIVECRPSWRQRLQSWALGVLQKRAHRRELEANPGSRVPYRHGGLPRRPLE